MSDIDILIKVRSVKDTFRKRLTPGIGNIDRRQRKPSKHEMSMAEVVVREFGGKIKFLKEKRQEGIKMPDAIWSGIKLEIKEASGKSSINNRVRKGVEQVGERGIIFLDISKNKKNIKEIRTEAINRAKRSKTESKSKYFHINIIFFKKGKVLDVVEIKKRKA